MGYADPDKQREFARNWRAGRRKEWFDDNGPCRRCWGTERLQVYYPDQSEKVEHRIWTWKKERRNEELKKCIILCQECWYKIRKYRYTSERVHGTALMYDKGGCRCQECRDAHAFKMRIFRGKDMALSAALEELSSIKNQLYVEIDKLSAELEQKQSRIVDIDTAIRVLRSLNGSQAHVSEIAEYKPDPPVVAPEPLDPDDKDTEALDSQEDHESYPETREEIVPPAVHGRRGRPPRATPVFLAPKKDVKVEPLAGASSVLGGEFFCERCRAKFMNKAALDSHNELRHSRSELENRCPVSSCKKNFDTQTDMENHVIHNHPKFAKECGYV